jgi:hypothetical protein
MTDTSFVSVHVVRSKSFVRVLEGLRAAGHAYEPEILDAEIRFLKAPERISRPSEVEMATLRFPDDLNSIQAAEKIATEAGCRLADFWETAAFMSISRPLFAMRWFLPLLVIGEPMRISGGQVRIPILPDLGNGIPPIHFQECGRYAGAAHFPVAKL